MVNSGCFRNFKNRYFTYLYSVMNSLCLTALKLHFFPPEWVSSENVFFNTECPNVGSGPADSLEACQVHLECFYSFFRTCLSGILQDQGRVHSYQLEVFGPPWQLLHSQGLFSPCYSACKAISGLEGILSR